MNNNFVEMIKSECKRIKENSERGICIHDLQSLEWFVIGCTKNNVIPYDIFDVCITYIETEMKGV